MKSMNCMVLMVVMVGLAFQAQAKGDAEAGKEKSTPCQACHGVDGVATDPNLYPNLGGQYESYLVKSLQDYRDGSRVNPLMSTFAANLSDQDIEDLAAWYASQDGLDILP